jgi:hypothetical protein
MLNQHSLEEIAEIQFGDIKKEYEDGSNLS